MLVSEHRQSYANRLELPDEIQPGAELTIFAISASRFSAVRAIEELRREGVRCNLVHLLWLKPFELTSRVLEPLERSGAGLVVDSGYEIAGASRSIAYELMLRSGCPVRALGLADRSPGVARSLENGTPSAERIVQVARELLRPAERTAAQA